MFFIGLDLGQRRDHSAIAVVERAGDKMLVRQVERVPLGTPYPRVVERVREVVLHPEIGGRCSLVVDGTGVGAPVVEMLRAAGLGCEITAVSITGGERESRSGGGWSSVPKQDLIAGVQVALESGELRIAKRLREIDALIRELVDVRLTANLRTGKVRVGADACGQHDDLVVALALAVWRARRKENRFGDRRLPGF